MKNDLSKLAQQAQSKPAHTPPLQQVKPVKPAPSEPDTPLNVRLPKSLVKACKVKALAQDTTLKEVIQQAVIQYLEQDVKP